MGKGIKDLKKTKGNPRIINDEQLEKLNDRLAEFGDLSGVVYNMQLNELVGGNQRSTLFSLKNAQIEYIEQFDEPTKDGSTAFGFITIDDQRFNYREVKWDKKKHKRAVLIANTNAGDWDLEALQSDDWADINFELDIDFSDDENLEDSTEGDNTKSTPTAEEDDYEVPEVEEIKTDIKLGDLFEIGRHRLLCGDSTDSDQVARLMDGQKADMVFTDPPYNVGYEGGSKKREMIDNDEVKDFYQFLYDAFVNCLLNTKSGASVYIAHSDLERANFTKAFIDAGFKLSSVIVWVKDNSTFSMSKDYKWKHEPIIYGWNAKGAHTFYGDTKQDTVWNIKRPSRSEEHPTMKPIELIAKAVNNSSKSDDLLFEPFTGSGSTMVAAHQLNRKCFGMELDPKYCQVIIDRMHKLDPSLIIKKNGVEI